MNKKIKDFFKYYKYCGFPKDVFFQYRAGINAANLHALTAASFISTAVFCVLFATSLFLPLIAESGAIYLFNTVFSLCVFVICRLVVRRRPHLSIVLLYIFLTYLFVSGTFLATYFQAENNSAIVAGMLALFPMFIVDRPQRTNIFFLGAVCFYIAFSFEVKPRGVALLGTVDTVFFFIISCCTTYYFSHTKISDIINKARIVMQRDTDALTHLTNRQALERGITRALERGDSLCVMLLLDIDKFKSVNDTFGHMAGDKVLLNTAEKLRSLFRGSDYVARLGGDEFVVFMQYIPSRQWALEKAQRTADALRGTVSQGENSVRVSASIGVAFSDDGGCSDVGCSYAELYKNADKAMYLAKQRGGDGYSVYSPTVSYCRPPA